MAWYYGTYSCGHEGRVNIVGKMSDRERKVKYHFEGICEECRAKEREEKAKEALLAEKDLDLPPLSGTEKQILWAAAIRMDFYRYCNKYKLVIDEMLTRETTARFWIDHREMLDHKFPAKYSRMLERESLQEQIKQMDVTKPEDISHDGIVEILETEGRICLKYERDEDFIQIVRGLHYNWDGKVWNRTLSETTGAFADRAAEAGHALLEHGFCISIHDENIAKMAVSGEFEEEHTSWIFSLVDTPFLSIHWDGRNDELYQQARKIKGAKWDRGSMLVDVSHYKAVEEFAKANDFLFTAAALKKIDAYKDQFR